MLNALKIASSRWGVAMGIFIIGFISYGLTLAFYAALFPRLVRNTRCICELRERYEQGEIAADEYEQAEALEKSKVSSLSIVGALFSSSRPPPVMTCRSSFRTAGFIAISSLDLALVIPLRVNTKVDNYVLLKF